MAREGRRCNCSSTLEQKFEKDLACARCRCRCEPGERALRQPAQQLEIICGALEKWKSLYNFDDAQLLLLQRQIPTTLYPWTSSSTSSSLQLPTYNTYRLNANRRFQVFPLALFVLKSEKDVRRAFALVKKFGLEFALRNGGHCFEPYSLITNGVVLDQYYRKRIVIEQLNNDSALVTVEAGVTLGELYAKLDPLNVIVNGGTYASVGTVAQALGGGLGFYLRRFGLLCDRLQSVRLLLADERVVEATKHNQYSDLFFASCGGAGGNFGIALSLTFDFGRLSPKKRNPVALFNYEYALGDRAASEALFLRFMQLAGSAPDNVTMQLNLNAASQIAMLAGVWIFGGEFTSANNVEKWLDERFTFANLERKSVDAVSVLDSHVFFAECSPARAPFAEVKNFFIDKPFDQKSISLLYDAFIFSESKEFNRSTNLFAFGGTVSKIPVNATAFPARTSTIWVELVASWDDDFAGSTPALAWISNLFDSLVNQSNGFSYVNIEDISLADYLNRYYGPNLDQLREIKTKYDPANVFHFAQSIPPIP